MLTYHHIQNVWWVWYISPLTVTPLVFCLWSSSWAPTATVLGHGRHHVHQRLHRHPQGCHDLPWQHHCWHYWHGGENPRTQVCNLSNFLQIFWRFLCLFVFFSQLTSTLCIYIKSCLLSLSPLFGFWNTSSHLSSHTYLSFVSLHHTSICHSLFSIVEMNLLLFLCRQWDGHLHWLPAVGPRFRAQRRTGVHLSRLSHRLLLPTDSGRPGQHIYLHTHTYTRTLCQHYTCLSWMHYTHILLVRLGSSI